MAKYKVTAFFEVEAPSEEEAKAVAERFLDMANDYNNGIAAQRVHAVLLDGEG